MLGVKRCTKISAGVSFCTLMSSGFFLVLCVFTCMCISKRKKASHTRYQALGLELINFGADPGVQSVSLQLTISDISYPPSGRLSLLSARPAVTFPSAEHHRPLAGTKLYCLVTEAHRCEQLTQGCYAALP